jgi:hypothetical protein
MSYIGYGPEPDEQLNKKTDHLLKSMDFWDRVRFKLLRALIRYWIGKNKWEMVLKIYWIEHRSSYYEDNLPTSLSTIQETFEALAKRDSEILELERDYTRKLNTAQIAKRELRMKEIS